MRLLVTICWFSLAVFHLPPALGAFWPPLLTRAYGVTATGDLALLLRHRALLFAAVVTLCLVSAFDPASRRAAWLATAISVGGFLVQYGLAGRPAGALRAVATVDVLLLLPLLVVGLDVFRTR